MRKLSLVLGCAAALFAGSASAELAIVSSQSDFVRLITGKTLSRPLIKIKVAEDGRISGKGALWAVTGDWTWRDGFFAGAFIGVDPNWAITVKKCVPAKGEFDLLLMVVKAIQPTLN